MTGDLSKVAAVGVQHGKDAGFSAERAEEDRAFPTIRAIARRFGISLSTVGERALRNDASVPSGAPRRRLAEADGV